LDFIKPGVATLVHCYAGQSRSPAIGVLAALKNGGDKGSVLAALDPRRVKPNTTIMKLGEQLLGIEGLAEATGKAVQIDTTDGDCDLVFE
jgi:predicted protein tyrosine phosphatase